MNKPLKTLYEQWCKTHKDTPEYDHAYDVFCEPSENIALEQANENGYLLAECVIAESEQAFCAGFQTAVQIMMNKEDF